MPEVASYAPGQPAWADVATPDVDAAAAFYTDLFGWEAERDSRPEAGGYTLFSRNGLPVASATIGDPARWSVYLASRDADETARRIRDAGGTVVAEPFDVVDAGRMAVASDPAGASFCVWQAEGHVGARLRGEPGTMNWVECQTRDRAAVLPFYEQVFDYESRPFPMGEGGAEYTVLHVNGEAAAGMIEIQPAWGDVPPNWSVVFQVEDADAAVETVRERGGSLVHGPTDLEGVGRFAVVADPWGATFQVIK